MFDKPPADLVYFEGTTNSVLLLFLFIISCLFILFIVSCCLLFCLNDKHQLEERRNAILRSNRTSVISELSRLDSSTRLSSLSSVI